MGKQLLYLVCMVLFSLTSASAQNYNISNSTVSTCSGNFYDSGGNGGNYGNNENFVMTFCSSVSGECIRLTFTSFDLESGFDFLTVYNGPNTLSPVLGTFTGTTLPGIMTSTTGCLTIEFTSDFIVNAGGFEATLNCVPCPGSPCPNCNGGSPPSNDACPGAQNLGALPAPAACPNGVGAWANFNTTNICATAENPYTTLTGCQPSGNMASPAADVWYRFTITGPTLNIQINGLQTPNIGLYAGTNCNNLIGRGCAIGGGSVLNTSFGGLAPGNYFLQVSGGNLTDQCDFTLALQNNYDCQGCVIQSGLTVNPPPANGTYGAGQTVTFCYTITDYNQTSINWMHAVVPTFGPGWDMGTLTTVPPVSCSGQGTWSWYNNSVTSQATGLVTGPGFYFESGLGSPTGNMDGNPGNNYGDNNPANACDWTFCWTITTLPVAQCVQGASLNITIDTYGDGESGSWTSLACTGDPVTDFFATMTCCEPPQISITDPLCGGQNSGSVTATGQGNAPWDYVWINGAGTTIQTANGINGSNTINNLAAGNYSLTVTDFAGCVSTVNFTINEPPVLTANVWGTNPACGLNNGTITASGTGGTGSYLYSLNGGPSQPGTVFSNLGPGSYNVVVTDANGCTASTNINLAADPAPVINTVVTNATCGNSNGVITANAAGGIPPYEYSINGGAYTPASTFSNLAPGNHDVSVRDANGCIVTATINVPDEPGPVITGTVPVDVTCFNGNDGTAVINVNGGTVPLQFILNGGTPQAANTFGNLTTGNYSVIVEDANGCTSTTTFIINEPAEIIIGSVVTPENCGNSDGTITINAVGGTGGFQYSINGGPSQTNPDFTGLPAGNYTITVTDANGCTGSGTNTIPLFPPPVIDSVNPLMVACNGDNTGEITITASGGTAPLQFSINGGAYQSSNIFTGLAASSYTITVTDVNGCTATTSINITEPPALTGSTVVTGSTCGIPNGEAIITGNGGTVAYSFSINGGTWQPTGTFTALSPGNYSYTIADANGCIYSDNFIITDAPGPVIANLIATPALCNGSADGSISLSSNGGTAPVVYSLNGGASQPTGNFPSLPAGNYSIVITDANGCTDAGTIDVTEPTAVQVNASATTTTCGNSNGTISVNANGGTGAYSYTLDAGLPQSSNNFTGLAAGNYTVTVSDANGCTATTTLNITDEPAPVIDQVIVTDVACNGGNDGSITVSVTGGTGTIQYSIDNGSNFQAATLFNNLPAGNYQVLVQDGNGCTVTSNVSISEPPVVTGSANTTPASCGNSDGSISAVANGGVPAYQFSIDNGSTNQPSGNFQNLPAGNYDVLITDANGCTAIVQASVNNTAAPSIQSINIVNLNCFSSGDGELSINVTGGTAPLQYSIDNGSTFNALSTFTGLAAGTYNIIVEDALGCQATDVAVITEPAELIFTTVESSTTCGLSNGSITINANGGTGAIQYSINGGTNFSANNFFNNIGAGQYNILISDANGCTASSTVNIGDAPGPVIQVVNTTDITCNGDDDGIININANGGTGILQFSIDNGTTYQLSASFSNLGPGTYDVVVSDINNCTSTQQVSINEPPALQLSSTSTPASCGTNDGSLTITANGGTGSLQYSIDNGTTFQAGNVFSNLAAGNYNLIVIDANGCQVTGTGSVNNAVAPVITSVTITDITCFGANNGNININASGGTGLLVYSIDNGSNFQAGNTFINLGPGNYNILVEDINGCQAGSTATIVEPSEIIFSNTITNTTCSLNNGALTITAGGGTGSLSYSINNGSTFQSGGSFPNLPAGVYDVVIEDDNGCQVSSQLTITDSPGPTLQSVAATDLSCFGANDGSITINITGGTQPVTFSIDNGATNQPGGTFTNINAGNYNIVITDANGCTVTSTAVINEPAAINASAAATPSTCGNSDGSITINANGGTGILQYSIDNGVSFQSSSTFSFLPAGNYDFTIQDGNGCQTTVSVVLNNAAAPVIQSLNFTNITCSGAGDGTILINANGGTGILQYSIDNGLSFQSTNSFSGLGPGIYNIIVTDINGCDATDQVTITEPPVLQLSAVTATATCGNNNGIITLSSGGGTGPVQFSIDGGVTFQSALNFSNLGSGSYNIIAQDSVGCVDSIAVNVPAAPGPVLSIVFTTDLTCNGFNDGSITIIANGGTAPLQYSIDNGATTSASNVYSSLPAGNYQILVTDANGCTVTSNNVLSQPAAIQYSVVITDANCGNNDGSITVNAGGGSGNYTYSKDNGASYQASNVFSNLTAGVYDILVRDGSDCTNGGPESVNNTAAPVISNLPVTNVTCNGMDDGTITVQVNGGTAPLNYSIDGGFSWNTLNNFDSLAAGNYTIWVEDANGCLVTDSASITEPAAITISVTESPASCGANDGSVTVSSNGGNGSLTYTLNGGPSQPTGVFLNLGAGNYTVVVTDQDGCTSTAVASVNNTNAPVISNVTGVTPDCSGSTNGSITVNATGGNGNLSYSINNGTTWQSTGSFANLGGGTYNIIVEDTNNCIATSSYVLTDPDPVALLTQQLPSSCGNANGQIITLASGGTGNLTFSIDQGATYQNDTIFTNLTAGAYTIIVIDANGCSALNTVSVTNLPGPVYSSLQIQNSTCYNSDDGTLTIGSSGGTSPVMYSIDGGTTFQAGNYFSGLVPGNYTLYITDANGCETDSMVTISEPSQILISLSITNSVCSDSNAGIAVSASGGTGGYSYSSDSGFVYQQSNIFSNLLSGIYNIAVSDSTGCEVTTSANITDSPAPVMQAATITDATCNGYTDGSLIINATGGSGALLYSIDNGTTFQSSSLFSSLAPGIYNYMVVDSNGCQATQTDTIAEPSAVTSVVSVTDALCAGSNDGTASVTSSGGTSPYTYSWATGSTGSSVSNLNAGNYNVTITDANGCTSIVAFQVDEPLPISVLGTVTDVSCFGLQDGAISVSLTGGTGPFTYNWTGGAVSGTGSAYLPSGIYTVTVSDANGCSTTQSFTLNQPSELLVSSQTTPVTCFGTNTGTASVIPSGGTLPYSYSWSNSSTLSAINSLAAGTYSVVITDFNGCSASDTVQITSPAQLVAAASSTNVTCAGISDGSVTVAVNGGTIPYTYSWNTGSVSSGTGNLPGGNYTVTITDANGCTIIATTSIVEPAAISLTAIGDTTLCIGQSAVINALATGGTAPYVYTWNNGITGASQTVSPGLTTAYTVSVTDSSGCTSTPGTVTITVNPVLSAIISDPDTICEGDPVTISVIANGGNGGPYNYVWNSLPDNSPQVIVTPQNTTMYSVAVSDGCGTPPVNVSVEIFVNLLPVVDFSPQPADGCAPLEVTFDNLTITSINGAWFEWQFGDNTISNDFGPLHIYTEPGFYDVTLKVISAEGCEAALTINDAVKVYPLPVAAFTSLPSPASVLNPEVSFTNQSLGASFYNWDFGDGSALSPEMNPFHTYSDTGIYQIVLYATTDYGCADTAFGEVIVEGTSTVYIPNAFTPNNDGKNDFFLIQGIGLTEVELSIFNRWGNKVHVSSGQNHRWDGKDIYSGQDCPMDVYIYLANVKTYTGLSKTLTGRVTLIR